MTIIASTDRTPEMPKNIPHDFVTYLRGNLRGTAVRPGEDGYDAAPTNLLATEMVVRRSAGEIPCLTAAVRSYANKSEPPFSCPITGYPCEGDLTHLCEEYGCARKGGLSPHSEENL